MKERSKTVLASCVAVVALVESVAASAASSAGPYYATPAWDQKLSCSTAANCARFIVLTDWNNEAVLDRETGLVWEQSPSTLTQNWNFQSQQCITSRTGGKTGWRLPTIQDLMSLFDVTSNSLPAGHPFSNVQLATQYWSATSFASDGTFAYAVVFNGGLVSGPNKLLNSLPHWCVRGGQPLEAQ